MEKLEAGRFVIGLKLLEFVKFVAWVLDEEGMRQIIIQEELLNLITITLREKMIGLSLKSQ